MVELAVYGYLKMSDSDWVNLMMAFGQAGTIDDHRCSFVEIEDGGYRGGVHSS